MNPSSIDWLARWESAVRRKGAGRCQDQSSVAAAHDEWQTRAADYARNAPVRDEGRRVTRAILASACRAVPNAEALDIGAGTGVWTVPMAGWAGHVTAVEPSPAMRVQLETAVAAAGVGARVTIVPRAWPGSEMPPHDVVLCAHVLYGIADFHGWIDAMTTCARELCVLLLRAPAPDDFMDAARRIIQPTSAERPAAFLAVNAMWQMGIRPHVLMEPVAAPYSEIYADPPAALADLKQTLHLGADPRHDQALTGLLERRLRKTPEGLRLPPRPPTAIVMWQPPGHTRPLLELLATLPQPLP